MPPKRTLKPFDPRIPQGQDRVNKRVRREIEKSQPKEIEQVPTALFFHHNEQLGPPYYVIVDTNFLNMCVKNKIEPIEGMMNCLYAKCIPVILDSVLAELEKLGVKYRVALRLARDSRFVRMPGYQDKGTYADDDIVMMVKQHRCFIVATQDRDLRRRIRKIPGVPIMYISQRKVTVERMPEAFGAPK
jgi:U3 small nucleolar RNA-associated protein 24